MMNANTMKMYSRLVAEGCCQVSRLSRNHNNLQIIKCL